MRFEHPAILADEMASGRLDVGLVPIFELLSRGGGETGYRVVDGVAIACHGPVHSVYLVHRGRLADVRTVRLDPASRTSVNLLRVLLAEFHGLAPRYEPLPAGGCTDAPALGEGTLLIGDQAIAFRARHASAGEKTCRFFDLGEQWQLATGLPFVFAAWLLRPDVPRAPLVADVLRAWRDAGLRALDQVIAGAERTRQYPPGFPAYYLTKCIRYGLGHAEKMAVAEYDRLLRKHRLINLPPPDLRWV